MVKAIFYKEFIKCRAVLSTLLLIAVALVIYLFIGNANMLRTSGAMTVWAQIAAGEFSLISKVALYFMPIAAIAIATMQYSLEMANKRFKLTLHLPAPEVKIISTMQIFGVAMTAALYIILLLPLYIGFLLYYPTQLIGAMFNEVVPFALAGFAAYFFAMWVIVEPTWRRRAAYIFIATAAMAPFCTESMLGATRYMTPMLAVIVAASVCCAFYSAVRFKNGAKS